MAYDDTSFYGDLIVNDYDEQNNFMNPVSPMGFYVYHILGDGFDLMSEYCTEFLNDISVLTANVKGLDNFWGISYNLPRPILNGEPISDEEYKVYLYLRNCRLLTREDLEICFNSCFAVEDYTVYFSEETNYLNVVDHNHYESLVTDESNLAKNNLDVSNEYIINQANSGADVRGLESLLSEDEEKIIVINIPSQNWSEDFLAFLEQFISVKGNLKIREYQL